jgi:hypothetical protein
MTAQQEIGPALPSRTEVYARAAELQALARIALDCACPGHRIDLPRALAQFDRMRAVLGEGCGDAD